MDSQLLFSSDTELSSINEPSPNFAVAKINLPSFETRILISSVVLAFMSVDTEQFYLYNRYFVNSAHHFLLWSVALASIHKALAGGIYEFDKLNRHPWQKKAF